MNRSVWHRRIPNRVAYSVLAVAIAGALVGSILVFTWSPTPSGPPPSALRAALPAGTYPPSTLEVGTPAPVFKPTGWLNGSPPQPGEQGPGLIVLDIWSGW